MKQSCKICHAHTSDCVCPQLEKDMLERKKTSEEVIQGALTPLGELVEKIQIFRNMMAQDRCIAHCKTYQEQIEILSQLAKNISKG